SRPHTPHSTLFPYTTLFRSDTDGVISWMVQSGREVYTPVCDYREKEMNFSRFSSFDAVVTDEKNLRVPSDQSDVNNQVDLIVVPDRKSTRLNSSHVSISYAV